MRAIAAIAFSLISALAWNAWAFQSASPAARAPYTASHGNTKLGIAWLDKVAGEVEIASSVGQDFHRALAQTALMQGNIIRTGNGGAEVQLQDQSTIRLGPGSVMAFPRLELLPSGLKTYVVSGVRGTIYVSLMPTYITDNKDIAFELTFGQQQVHLQPSGHIRLEMDPKEAQLATLDGKGSVEGPFGSMELAKKRTITFDLTGESQPAVTKKVASNPLDKWDAAAVAYQRHGLLSHSHELFQTP